MYVLPVTGYFGMCCGYLSACVSNPSSYVLTINLFEQAYD
ncbi:putative septum site-determining MinC [Gossypium arboreum]|uniref:Putative septum site-determining MinC n=1 Tax=Gossypium arboreum TaxID=29729 RepID=A0A0B0MF45_GOSAR|nr:putative septum site-determining MinC [Gossypium arboreum]